MEGGIDPETAPLAVTAGADVLVAGSNEEEGFANAMETFVLGEHREVAEKAS